MMPRVILAMVLWFGGLVEAGWSHWFFLTMAATVVAACAWASLMRQRRWAPETAFGASLALLWLATPPTTGLDGLLTALAMGAMSAGYFLLRFSLRLPVSGSAQPASGAVRHGTQRILLLAMVGAVASWATLSLPAWLAGSVGPRWAASVDATSLPLATTAAILALCAALGLRLAVFVVAFRRRDHDAAPGKLRSEQGLGTDVTT